MSESSAGLPATGEVSCSRFRGEVQWVKDDEVAAMDRDEHPFASESGETSAVVCLSEPPIVDEAAESTPVVTAWSESPPVVVEPSPTLEESPAEEPARVTPEQIVEALLFASDAPLAAGRLAELSGLGTARHVEEAIQALNDRYAAAGLSFRIQPIARGFQMLTLPVMGPWLARLDRQRAQTRLTPAALETLSIVAYKQPVIRADVETIRGVACGEVLNRLREMGLIRIVGRAEIVGRPLLYGTTRKFLDVFGLADLDELPPMEALSLRTRPAQPEPRLEQPTEPPQDLQDES